MPATPRARLREEGGLAPHPRGPQHPPNKIILGLPAPPTRDKVQAAPGRELPGTPRLLSTADRHRANIDAERRLARGFGITIGDPLRCPGSSARLGSQPGG